MDREQLDQILERSILVLVLGILVFSPLAFGAVRDTEFGVVIGLILAVLIIWVIRLWVTPTPQLLWPPVCWAVFAFVVYAAVRTHFAVVQFDARREFLQVLVYAVLFFVILNHLYRKFPGKVIAITLIVMGLGLSIYGVSQFLTGDNMVLHKFRPGGYAGRASGTFVNPNHLAGYLIMILPLAISLTVASRLNHAVRVFTGYSALAMLAGVVVSLSRGGWIAATAVLILLTALLLTKKSYRWPAVVLLVMVLGIGLAFYVKAEKKIVERVNLAMNLGHNRDPRWRLWPSAVQVWQENPWWGVGPAHYDHHYRTYRLADNLSQDRPRYVHNEYLNTLADYGVVGCLILAVGLALTLGGAWRTWQALVRVNSPLEERRGSRRAFLLGTTAGLLGILLHALTDFHFHIPANAILLVVLMALTTSYLRFSTDRYWVSMGVWTKTLATLCILLVGGYLGHLGWRQTSQALIYQRATAAGDPARVVAEMEKAAAIDPHNYQVAYQLGEFYRRWSWQGDKDYRVKAEKALGWFQKAMDLNPYDVFALTHYGMCLHWLGRHEEAAPYYQRALELDPNLYYVQAQMGWHKFQLRRYAEAKSWFEKSLRLNWWNNQTSYSYLSACAQRLAEPR